MSFIKKSFKSRISIGLIFFVLGFLTNHFLKTHNEKKMHADSNISMNEDERIPVTPEDFDHGKMLKSLKGKNTDIDREEDESERGFFSDSFNISPNRKEDDKFVYYEIPMKKNDKGENRMNVEVKGSMIHIKSDSKDGGMSSSMEQVFSIGPGLDETKAEVINGNENIVIKIPKKNN